MSYYAYPNVFVFFFWGGFYNCSVMFMSLGLCPWMLTYKLQWELHYDFAVWAWYHPNSPRNSLVWILWGRTEQCSPNSPRGGHASFNTTFLFCSQKLPHLSWRKISSGGLGFHILLLLCHHAFKTIPLNFILILLN